MKTLTAFCMILLSVDLGQGLKDEDWWRAMSLYQIYPRSFKDSDGDGVGDLKGITSKLFHLKDLKVNAFWLSPIYPSPMVDFGYDISDFVNIDPIYGTMQDFEDLVKVAHEKSLRVIMDLVPNHSSDKHEWFEKSLMKIEPYTDYYVWHKGKVLENGTVVAPNNWVSVFGGPAWTWREERQAYYLHQFAPEQPDLNYNNEDVVREMQDVMRFWLNKGVDGFRVDAVPHLCEDDRFLDEPVTGHTTDPNNYGYTEKIYTKDQPRTYDMVRGWRGVLDEYSSKDGLERIMMIEAYANVSMTMKYYEYGAHFPFNFGLITDADKNSKASDFERLIDKWMSNMPAGGVANWVTGNHDKERLVTRFGLKRAEAITMMTLLLPGIAVTYNGEEIGMENTWISWEDTKDPQGCNAGKEGYESSSRDPARTPFQWDDTTSAGFSTNPKTWLPVNKNYKTLNLEAQKKQEDSYYNVYKQVAQVKASQEFDLKNANFVMKRLSENVLAYARETSNNGCAYVVVNFGNEDELVDLSKFGGLPEKLTRHVVTTGSSLAPRTPVTDVTNLRIPASEAVLYVGFRE